MVTGDTLGPYRVLDKLGEGGMGRVWFEKTLGGKEALLVESARFEGTPNSRWMAYASDESGRFEIYVRPFPAASGQSQVSLGGGMQPEWRGDGKLTVVPVTTDGPAFTAGTPQALFDVEIPEPSAPYSGDYAVTADGQRFFVNTVVDQPTRPALTVILNWAPERKR